MGIGDVIVAVHAQEFSVRARRCDSLEPLIDPLTRLVLTNAIYFKGNWDRQFKKELTKEEPFFLGLK